MHGREKEIKIEERTEIKFQKLKFIHKLLFERKWPLNGVAILGGVVLLEKVCKCRGGL